MVPTPIKYLKIHGSRYSVHRNMHIVTYCSDIAQWCTHSSCNVKSLRYGCLNVNNNIYLYTFVDSLCPLFHVIA